MKSLTGLLSMRVRSRRTTRTYIWLLVSSMAVGQLIVPRDASAQNVRPQPSLGPNQKPVTVLFICPHGAAKSVLASAYFQREARARGLDVRVEAAGTEPQEAVSPVVEKHLERGGYRLPVTKPRAVTKEDVNEADVVISLGCDVTRFPAAPRALRTWDDVPAPSDDLKAADDAIRRRVIALVEELLANPPKK